MVRRRWTVALLLAACLAAACAARTGKLGRPAWRALIPWGTGGVSVGRTAAGAEYGPLAAAVSPCCLAVADSFGGRLLVWTRSGRGWSGPRAVGLPSAVPVTALSWGGPGGRTLAALDASCTAWRYQSGGGVRQLVTLTRPGALCVPGGIALTPTGVLWLDVTLVSAEATERAVYAAPPGASPRAAAAAVVARVGGGTPTAVAGLPRMVLWPGVRGTLGADGHGRVWALGATASGRPAMFVLTPHGPQGRGRSLPALAPPADFLGVGPGGRALFVVASGGARQALLAVDGAGRSVRRVAFAPGQGPRLGDYAALARDGGLLLLRSERAGLVLQWYPPGRWPRR